MFIIRKSTDEDITEEEYLKIIAPFNDNYHEFLESYVLPEIIAFYIFFYKNSMGMAGVKRIKHHDFRHSCASILVNK